MSLLATKSVQHVRISLICYCLYSCQTMSTPIHNYSVPIRAWSHGGLSSYQFNKYYVKIWRIY